MSRTIIKNKKKVHTVVPRSDSRADDFSLILFVIHDISNAQAKDLHRRHLLRSRRIRIREWFNCLWVFDYHLKLTPRNLQEKKWSEYVQSQERSKKIAQLEFKTVRGMKENLPEWLKFWAEHSARPANKVP